MLVIEPILRESAMKKDKLLIACIYIYLEDGTPLSNL